MDKRYDVVIARIDDRTIESIIGKNMSESQAEKREMTGLSRIDTSEYFVAMVDHDPNRQVHQTLGK